MQNLGFEALTFPDKSNQWVKVLSSKVSLKWGKCPKCTKRCIIQLTVIRLENFRLITMYHYPWFKGLGLLFPISSMHQIYQQFNSLTNSNLQTLCCFWFIPFDYLEVVNNKI